MGTPAKRKDQFQCGGVPGALGAQQGSVRSMILRETLALALLGIAIAIPSGSPQLASSPAGSSASLQATCPPS